MKKQLNLIVAMTDMFLIGILRDPIPWKLTDDFLQNFVPKTTGNAVVMGRKTFETLKGPLKDRLCIVLTRDTKLKKDGFVFVGSVEEAVKVAEEQSSGDIIWCIGGAEIYNLFQNSPNLLIDEYHITVIEGFDKLVPPGEDIFFFPNLKNYKLTSNKRFEKRNPNPDNIRDRGNEYPFSVKIFKRK